MEVPSWTIMPAPEMVPVSSFAGPVKTSDAPLSMVMFPARAVSSVATNEPPLTT
ncbi:hypothetical protein GOB93_16270 [Acetobacter musti]|uniref:Uncharacterized protein n=1 Tax=Acetobacter musti TaxID=864732 RepID=A0ABX0JUL8_9PROT|nr:hypothetical protein [Acetobacter musti]NHN86185.1 hypothetical protein [Acetobacter musti]